MDGLDGATWQALGLVLTLLGLGVSAVVWARRGPARGLRGVAWSLLPLAAGLTGVLRLGWEVGESVVDFAARLVFSPVVWIGMVVAALSAVLFVLSGWMLRRSAPRVGTRHQVAGPRGAALPGTGRPAADPRRGGAGRTGSGTDDLADIEEILRRHGIQ